MLILRGQNQRFETLIQNADPKRRSREYCLCFPREEDDFVSMHCALFEAIVRAQVNRKGVIWRHLNVVICDFAFMLPPESAFCSNHDRKRTFLGCVHAYFAKAESAFWNADSKRRSKTPFTGVLFMLPSRRRRFRWACTAHCSRLLFFWAFWISVLKRRLFENKHGRNSVLL